MASSRQLATRPTNLTVLSLFAQSTELLVATSGGKAGSGREDRSSGVELRGAADGSDLRDLVDKHTSTMYLTTAPYPTRKRRSRLTTQPRHRAGCDTPGNKVTMLQLKANLSPFRVDEGDTDSRATYRVPTYCVYLLTTTYSHGARKNPRYLLQSTLPTRRDGRRATGLQQASERRCWTE